jgi:hypothetical protein
MYSYSVTIEVNPPGAAPVLTHEQLWKGLVMKAENAVSFEAADSWEVRERLEDGLIVDAVIAGRRVTEGIALSPRVQVKYEHVTGGMRGWAADIISEDGSGKLLFTSAFAVTFPDAPDESDEERARGDAMKARLGETVLGALRVIRGLAGANKI